MTIAQESTAVPGAIRPVCQALGVSRATFYRRRRASGNPVSHRHRQNPRRLGDSERQEMLRLLTGERFVNLSVSEVYARILDEGRYLCSIRTMYRILSENKLVRERRDQLRHPEYKKPELLATRPNQVWSWDITKLKGPFKGDMYSLYVILDVFSRYVVAWLVASSESSMLAMRLIRGACEKQGIRSESLKIHSDRGSPMRSEGVASLLASLGVSQSFSRPHVSNDNPYSESQFKTLKYHGTFPERFGSLEDSRSYLQDFFEWYNQHHRHGGIGLMTPANVHSGEAKTIYEKREAVLKMAYEQHPERFVRGVPHPPELPKEVWINKPVLEKEVVAVAV